ncbi:MAG TPA: DUF3830 family protein [Candidatus Limnocylindria bacterium]
MKSISVEIGGARARFRLLEDVSPNTAAALWDTLPISEQMTHARWAGAACWLKVDRAPLAKITEPEWPVTSIYKGTLVLRPDFTGSGRVELYLSYGQAESRHERGRTYVTPVAEVTGDATALYEAMAKTWKSGAVAARIERMEEDAR